MSAMKDIVTAVQLGEMTPAEAEELLGQPFPADLLPEPAPEWDRLDLWPRDIQPGDRLVGIQSDIVSVTYMGGSACGAGSLNPAHFNAGSLYEVKTADGKAYPKITGPNAWRRGKCDVLRRKA